MVLWLCPQAVEAASFDPNENVISPSYRHSGAVACFDVDGDGDIDVVGVERKSGAVISWAENNGDGSSWTFHSLSPTFETGAGVYAADLESDGDMDLMTVARGNTRVGIWKNDGSQNFTLDPTLDLSANPFSLVPADVDGDGDLDLVVSGEDLEWFEQTGVNSGSFDPNSTVIDSGSAGTLFAADLDADGDTDLINGDESAQEVRIHLNNGSGGFSAQTVSSGTDATPDGVAAGDMDDDGDLDVVVAWAAGADGLQIEWFEQSGLNSGTIVNTPITVDASVDGPRGIFVDDIDGDGVADVAAYVADAGTGAPDERSVLWWANDPNAGTFTQHDVSDPNVPFGDQYNDRGDICLADVDGDGRKDVVAVSANDLRFSWWSGVATAGAPVANSTALALGWMEECARTWDGTSYVLIAPESGAVCSSTTTAFGIWEGFWVLADQELELVIPPWPGSATGNTTESLTGIAALEYDLIGVPLDPNDGDVAAVVGDDLGGAGEYESKWRVVKYDVATEAYDYYTGTASLPEFAPGRGFWLIHNGSVADPVTIDVEGSELHQVVGSPPLDGARVVDLSKPNAGTAKHMAANPYDYSVEWGRVKFRSPEDPGVGVTARHEPAPGAAPGAAAERTEAAVARADGVEQEGASGGVVEARGARHLRGGRGVEKPSDRRWLLDLHVREVDGPARDVYNRLGVVPGSADGRDRHDALDLAPFGTGWVRLYFPHDDPSLQRTYWRREPRRLTNDIRRPRRGKISWVFAVESDMAGREWVLSWPTLGQLPSGMRLRLEDLGTGRSVNPMRETAYRFRLGGGRRLFRLDVVTYGIGEEHGELSGVVIDGEGRPVRARVEVSGPGRYRHTIETDGRGRYRLPGLDPGRYSLEVVTAGGGSRTLVAEVPAERRTHRVLRLRDSARDEPGS
jgi:hypothetical protein